MTDPEQKPPEEADQSRGRALEELRRLQEHFPSVYEEAMRQLREAQEKEKDERDE